MGGKGKLAFELMLRYILLPSGKRRQPRSPSLLRRVTGRNRLRWRFCFAVVFALYLLQVLTAAIIKRFWARCGGGRRNEGVFGGTFVRGRSHHLGQHVRKKVPLVSRHVACAPRLSSEID